MNVLSTLKLGSVTAPYLFEPGKQLRHEKRERSIISRDLTKHTIL